MTFAQPPLPVLINLLRLRSTFDFQHSARIPGLPTDVVIETSSFPPATGLNAFANLVVSAFLKSLTNGLTSQVGGSAVQERFTLGMNGSRYFFGEQEHLRT